MIDMDDKENIFNGCNYAAKQQKQPLKNPTR